MRSLRIVFMGTPDFAVASLDALLQNNYEVVGVVTAPDKPAGRGRKLQQSAVKKYALQHQIPLFQPVNLKDESFLKSIHDVKANLYVVVAFRMLPKAVWQIPEYGTFNLHASLLPDYRGAAPINWAIINGEKKTGVTTFFIDEKIDTGTIILKRETTIEDAENAGQLHDKLMKLGSKLIVETVQLIEKGKVTTQKQPENADKSAPKIFTETCKINWQKPQDEIYNFIRGLNPYPAAWTYLEGNKKLKIYDVEKKEATHNYMVGKIFEKENKIFIAVKNGFIEVKSLQLAGKRKMDSKSFLNGYSFDKEMVVS